MFTNINPLTPRKIEKAFAPIPGLPTYAVMQAHSALRPPHMLSSQPHVYAVSSERISNTRGDQMDESADNNTESYLDPSFSQFVVTGEILDSPSGAPSMTAEQAMEADAARALEELAVAGSWHAMPETHATETYSPRSPNLHPHPFGPPPAFPAYPTLAPLSSTHSPDQNLDGHGSEMEGDETQQQPTSNDDANPPAYFHDDGTGHALPIRRFVAYNPRKRVTGAPVPVPHLTKPSRGRRVPIAAPTGSEDEGEAAPPDRPISPPSRSTTASPYGTRSGTNRSSKTPGTSKLSPSDFVPKVAASMRSYICQVDGCGKAFRRGEHLKRHIRSLHTHEKPERCTYPGCGKEFSRKDNMQQHLKIHTSSRHSSKRDVDDKGHAVEESDGSSE